MTSDGAANPVFSIFTLAFLKDSGWYDVDFNIAEKFFYGKDEGCGFLTQACFDKTTKMPNFP